MPPLSHRERDRGEVWGEGGPLPAFGHPPLVGEGLGDQRGLRLPFWLLLAPLPFRGWRRGRQFVNVNDLSIGSKMPVSSCAKVVVRLTSTIT